MLTGNTTTVYDAGVDHWAQYLGRSARPWSELLRAEIEPGLVFCFKWAERLKGEIASRTSPA